MSTFPNLAEILEQHRPYGLDCKCRRPINSDEDWVRHVFEVLTEACTISTAKQLDALPDRSVIRSESGDRWVWEKRSCCSGADWFTTETSARWRSGVIPLPALLIWHPAWERP